MLVRSHLVISTFFFTDISIRFCYYSGLPFEYLFSPSTPHAWLSTFSTVHTILFLVFWSFKNAVYIHNNNSVTKLSCNTRDYLVLIGNYWCLQGKTTEGKGGEEGSAPPAGTAGPGVTYQLYYSPEMAKLNQLGPALQLEKRIDRLETLLGNDQDKLVRGYLYSAYNFLKIHVYIMYFHLSRVNFALIRPIITDSVNVVSRVGCGRGPVKAVFWEQSRPWGSECPSWSPLNSTTSRGGCTPSTLRWIP